MIELKKITHENLSMCIGLTLSKEQKEFISSNAYSLAEAYVSISNAGFATPYAIYDNDIMVGYIMYTYANKSDMDGLSTPLYNIPCYYIWHIMIDFKYQRKGYAKQAIKKIIEEIKAFPHGKADNIYTSYHPDNTASKLLFSSLGFIETGEIDNDELDDYESIITKLDI